MRTRPPSPARRRGGGSSRPLPRWITAVAAGGAFAALFWLERRRPLRHATEDKARRTARNLAVAGLSGLAVQLAEEPVTRPLARWVERRRFGLVQRLPLPSWARGALAVLLLDYTLFWWHVLVHRVPWLWRFHQPHHVDLDLDASTALRFHFGEMLLSVPWRAAQVALIGVSPRALSLWQAATLVEILFHHANVELPPQVERRLARVLVTPRMHGIHHSIVPEETDSNFSNLLSVWDRLHGFFRLDVPQEAVRVGVAAYRDPAEVRLGPVLEMPFVAQRESWRLPGGAVPRRGSGGALLADAPGDDRDGPTRSC